MSAQINNLVCDAVPDPPRFSKDTNLNEPIRSQAKKSEEAQTHPEINNEINKHNLRRTSQENGNASDDRDSNQEKEQEKKPKSKRPSRNSKSGGTVINNVVKDSSNVYFNFSTQNLINIQSNPGSMNRRDSERSEEKCKKMPSHIQDLSECHTTISGEDKLKTKQYIGKNWKRVAKKLGFKRGEVEQRYLDFEQEGIGEVVYQILTAWEQRRGKHATLGVLIMALWTAEEYDCAEELAAIHSSTTKLE